MAMRIAQFICGLWPSGHDTLMKLDGGRMWLECQSCGHVSPGWDVDDTTSTSRDGVSVLHINRYPQRAQTGHTRL